MVAVPCNGCTACCRYRVTLDRTRDDPSLYDTEPFLNPITLESELVLKHKPDGTCVHLGEGGCTVHDHAPSVCQEFDCRRFYQATPRNERRAAAAQVGTHKEVLAAGKARLKVWGK